MALTHNELVLLYMLIAKGDSLDLQLIVANIHNVFMPRVKALEQPKVEL